MNVTEVLVPLTASLQGTPHQQSVQSMTGGSLGLLLCWNGLKNDNNI